MNHFEYCASCQGHCVAVQLQITKGAVVDESFGMCHWCFCYGIKKWAGLSWEEGPTFELVLKRMELDDVCHTGAAHHCVICKYGNIACTRHFAIENVRITANMCFYHMPKARLLVGDTVDVLLALVMSTDPSSGPSPGTKCSVCDEPCVTAKVRSTTGTPETIYLCRWDFASFMRIIHRYNNAEIMIEKPSFVQKETRDRFAINGPHCYVCGKTSTLEMLVIRSYSILFTIRACTTHAQEIKELDWKGGFAPRIRHMIPKKLMQASEEDYKFTLEHPEEATRVQETSEDVQADTEDPVQFIEEDPKLQQEIQTAKQNLARLRQLYARAVGLNTA